MHPKILFFVGLVFFSSLLFAYTPAEIATNKHMAAILHHPKLLRQFLIAMPKGADLHNHIGGASYAENMMKYASQDHLCVDRQSFTVTENPDCPPSDLLTNMMREPATKDALIDEWSMRHFHSGSETGHNHFFASFSKYFLITEKHIAEIVAEIANRAGKQNELYLELMSTPDENASGQLGKKLGWNRDFSVMRQQLLNNGLDDILNEMSATITNDEAKQQKIMSCGTSHAQPGCQVKIRYLYQVLREQEPEQVFAQLLTGFESATRDARIVGINLVQPEDGNISMRDYDLQMKMIGYLHSVYPAVKISLHAGELVPGLVPKSGLKSHIREAVEVAHANRIGHGVDIRYEDHDEQLMDEMAKKQIMVEINLVSNDEILNVSGKKHPLWLYMKHGVPVALSTDDEGVSRTNLTDQYVKAVVDQHLDYLQLKSLSRNSLKYSFLPENEKAAMELELEKRFSIFEQPYNHN